MEKISHEAGEMGNFNSRRCFHGIQQLIPTGVATQARMGGYVGIPMGSSWMGCRGRRSDLGPGWVLRVEVEKGGYPPFGESNEDGAIGERERR